MFRSKIEVREYALNKAIELLGAGTPVKQAVEKAKEFETYIIGEAELPETIDENEVINTILEVLTGVAVGLLNPNAYPSADIAKGSALTGMKTEKTE